MKNINITKLIIVFCASFFLISCTAFTENTGTEKAKGFVLRDTSDNTVNLDDILGKKVVLLNFFATWCPPCNEEVPALKKLFEEYKNKAAIFVIDIAESKAKVSSFISKKAINYPILLDDKSFAANLYSVRGIPDVIVIDINKNVQYHGHSLEEGRAALEKLIK